MSLYGVMRPTVVQDEVCVDEFVHGKPGRWDATKTVVWTRFGRACKHPPISTAIKVGGVVKDLLTGAIVFDASEMGGVGA